jgi:hypothetical protein
VRRQGLTPCTSSFPLGSKSAGGSKAVEIPTDLAAAYFEALSQLPSLVAAAASREWQAEFLVCALSAVAAAKGQPSVAEAVLELTPDVADEFMEWLFNR